MSPELLTLLMFLTLILCIPLGHPLAITLAAVAMLRLALASRSAPSAATARPSVARPAFAIVLVFSSLRSAAAVPFSPSLL